MNSKDNFIALLKFYSFIYFYFAFTHAQNTNDIPTVENTILHEHSCFSKATLVGVAFGCIMATLVVTVILCMIVWYYFSKIKKPVTNSNGVAGNDINPTNNGHCVAYENSQFKPDEPSSDTDHNEIVRISTVVTVDEHGNNIRTPVLATIDNTDDSQSKDHCAKEKKSNENKFDSIWKPKKYHSSTDSLNSTVHVFVPLKSKDYSGLGFSIQGNLTNGIFIKSVSRDGPAKESDQIDKGDRIISLKINFENIVYEDALTILNYSSPYPLTLEIEKMNNIRNDTNFITETTTGGGRLTKFHPLFKCSSVSNIVRKSSQRKRLDNFLNKFKSSTNESETKSKIDQSEQQSATLIAAMNLIEDKSVPIECSSKNQMMETDLPIQITHEAIPTIITTTQCSNLIEEVTSVAVVTEPYAAVRSHDTETTACWPNSKNEMIFRSRSEERLIDHDFRPIYLRSSSSMNDDIDLTERFQTSRHSKRDSGYSTLHQHESREEDGIQIEKEQLDKLLYFQNQLTRQQEELSRLGISVPIPTFLPISRVDF